MEKQKKPRNGLKIARIAAGYNKPKEFVAAINQDLKKKEKGYQMNLRTYTGVESGYNKTIELPFAYYVSEFLNIPITLFIEEKIFSPKE